MRGEWCYYKNRFTKEQCDFIITTIKSRPAQDSTMGVEGKVTDDKYRRSRIRWVYPQDAQLGFIFDELWKMAIQSNDDFFDFHLSKMTYIQVAEYRGDQQGEYKTHHDVFYMNNDPKYHRKLSAIVQLSDPAEYEGGDFQVYETSQVPDPIAIKTQGSAIFFPSFIRHAALPVTKGTRFSIAAWIDGPKWR